MAKKWNNFKFEVRMIEQKIGMLIKMKELKIKSQARNGLLILTPPKCTFTLLII